MQKIRTRITRRTRIGIRKTETCFLIVAIVLTVFLAGCRTIEPAPVETPASPTSTAIQAVLPPTEIATQTTVPATKVAAAGSPLFPGVDFVLQADFPVAKDDVTVYRKGLHMGPINPSDLAEAAGKSFGITGRVYKNSAERPGELEYLVTDGKQRLFFSWAKGVYYEYQSGNPALFPAPGPGCKAPCRPEKDSLTHSLLTDRWHVSFDFETTLSQKQGHTEIIIPLLDKIPVIFSPENGPEGILHSDENGQLLWMRYREVSFEPAGERKLLSAQAAWQKLLAGQAGAVFHEYVNGPEAPREWLRVYPQDTDLTVYGIARVYQPQDGRGDPLIFINGYPVSGQVKGLAEAAAGGRLVQAWGKLESGGGGEPALELTGWQTAVQPEAVVEGVIQRQGQDNFLVAKDSRFRLPDPPADLPENAPMTAYGVQTEDAEPALEWYQLREGASEWFQTSGLGFLPLNVNGTVSASAEELPPGKVEGLSGAPEVIVHQFSDGSTQVEVQFSPDEKETALRLDGPGIEGIEAYHRLPVRIWGVVQQADGGRQSIQVERFEPIYPGAKIEAWLGMLEQVNLDGHFGLKLTTPDDEQYLIDSSIDNAQVFTRISGMVGGLSMSGTLTSDPMIVEGLLLLDKTFGGYPVIRDLAWYSGIGRNDLEGYQIASAQPRIVIEPGTAGARRRAVVEAIRLVYYAPVLTEMPQAAYEVNLAQPAWQFSGHFEDGAYLEILVQAAEV